MTKNKNEYNGNSLPYSLAFRLPVAFRSFYTACQQKLTKVCASFEQPELCHLTVKFLGFSSEFLTETKVIELLPTIYEVAKNYLPLKIYVRGFEIFSYAEKKSRVVFLKVLPNKALTNLHHEFCDHFPEFEIFSHADKDNFQPHITLSKDLKTDCDKQLQRILLRSKKTAKRHVKVSDLVVMTPYRLFPVAAKINDSLICPPVK